MKRTRLTQAAAAPVLALLCAAALTACGGSDSGSDSSDGSKDSADKSGTSDAPEKAADPAADLDRAVLAKDEVKGYRIDKPAQEFVFAKSKGEIKLDKADCAPLAYAMNQLPLGTPKADAIRVAAGAKGPGAFTYVTLATYEKGAAKTALAELSKAVSACGGGFTAKAGKTTNPYSSIAAETAPAPAGADESFAFKATQKYQNNTHTLRAQAARHGDTIALYFAVDGLAFTQSRPGDAKIATAVVNAQSAKLG
ncbi:hypothetical protein [Streptomyces kanamyceticus]|uniref:Sensor domain-containing protein n=1 Tax=Streptomyces kanamyceticus TaxID=1967 RepID=A0A5J6GHD4_STRKN|nr:hypothetical protein [Streptomyces kanamyceticus]QEU92556.1 hypothetical protein CP970_18065 [Streptomyces kanamyceticus]